MKLWDAWKCSADDQECEASIYLKLCPLWGKYIPALRVKSPLEFYYALIIEYIEVIPVIVKFSGCSKMLAGLYAFALELYTSD